MSILKVILKKWSFSLLILTSIISLVFVKLDLLPESLILSLILIILCIFSINQMVDNEKKYVILENIDSGNVSEKVSISKFYREFKSSILNAEESVDLMLLQSNNPLKGNKNKLEYFKSIDRIVKKDKIKIRRALTIEDTERLVPMLKSF